MRKPEILAPAGNLEKLKIAIDFGADAVYIGGAKLNLRAFSNNFSNEEMIEGIKYCHDRGKRIYVTLNVFARNHDLPSAGEYIKGLYDIGVDAVIVADPSLIAICKEVAPQLEIHLSTQANTVNWMATKFWYDLGVKRIVLARELTFKEINEITENIPKGCDIEAFVHGSMCVAYSGRCLISNYMIKRDANKGICGNVCRYKYYLVEETRPGEYYPVIEDDNGTYIMNSKDMCMIEHIPELIKAGVSSFKIEGRAKTEYYTAVVTNAYRSAVDAYLAAPSGDFKPAQWILDEVYRISHRDYCTGFFFGSPRDDAQIYYKGGYIRSWEVAAIALKSENGTLTVSQRNRFFEGDELEIMNRGKAPTVVTVKNLKNALGESVDNAPNPMAEFTFDCDADVPAGAFIRRSTDGK